MPSMLGAEVLHTWNGAGVSFRTIVLSAMDHDDLVIELLEMGAVDFIRKPFNIRELVVRVRRHLPVAQAVE
jgi:two-component system copper resistance phosphate regulon response regulator CusR